MLSLFEDRELSEIADRGEELDIAVITQCCHGKPSLEISNYADGSDATLIVVGCHGHSHAGGEQIGSVTDRVVQNAGRPVLVAT